MAVGPQLRAPIQARRCKLTRLFGGGHGINIATGISRFSWPAALILGVSSVFFYRVNTHRSLPNKYSPVYHRLVNTPLATLYYMLVGDHIHIEMHQISKPKFIIQKPSKNILAPTKAQKQHGPKETFHQLQKSMTCFVHVNKLIFEFEF